MREIKFQSIHRHYKEGDVIFSEWGPQNGLFVAPTSISGYTLEGHRQYTGLKDKNGKEIYEGDIISDGHSNLIVEWWDDSCEYILNHKDGLHSLTINCSDWSEVIGNIYQHKHLLE